MSDRICWCFGYTEEDILKDLELNGRSLIMEKIMEEKRLGKCDCVGKNPKGR